MNALDIIPIKTDSCPTMDKQAEKKKMTVSWGKQKFGDIILFDFNKNKTADHIGIVIGTGGSNVYTVEGNTGSGSNTNGGQVQDRTRTKSTIKRFVRPKYNNNVTPAMIVYTALGEVGIKESPKNSNKVKYNKWFYNKNVSAYWCCTFVCWLYAHAEDIPKVNRPSGIYSGTIPMELIKYGSKGSKIGQLQKFLNWYHKEWNLKVDNEFGPMTMRALMVYQNTEDLEVDGVWGSKSSGRAKKYKTESPSVAEPVKSTPQPVATSTYKGTFPRFPKPKIIECTRSVNGMRKHGLLSGNYILRFKSEERRYKMCKFSLATVGNKKITYSNHPKFEDKVKKFGYNLAKVKTLKTSANCSNFIDGAVGAVTGKYVRDLGAKHNKKYLSKTNFFTSHKYSKGALLAGDICGTSKHTWMIIYGSAISIGCEGANVKRLQAFLNWAGFNCGTPDGDFGMKTLSAVKAFQTKVGLEPDGVFGPKSLEKAKTYKK